MLEAAGQFTEAVQLFHQAQDWDSVARAIKQHALTLFYQGRWQTINDWYSGMPTTIAASDTWLVYWRARALTAGDTLRARGLLEVAFTRFCEANDDVGVFACAIPLWETVMLLGEPWSAYKTWLPVLEAALSCRDGKADAWLDIEGWEAYLIIVVFALGRGALLGGEFGGGRPVAGHLRKLLVSGPRLHRGHFVGHLLFRIARRCSRFVLRSSN
jgi:hypothetical protein